MNRLRLFTPGPTPVPEVVRNALALPMIHHRSEEFSSILTTVRRQINELADNEGDSVILACSGTGGMEASVASLFSPGDEVVIVEGGKFGERWIDLATHYDLNLNVLHVPWGKSVAVDDVRKAVTPTTKGVLLQACESSTGAYHPVAEIGQSLKTLNCLLVVDAITALGVNEISMRKDGIDVLICGSQKALMNPPGVATVSLSQRAISHLSTQESQSFYLSLQRELKNQTKNQTAFTPAINLVRGLGVALDIIFKEGKPNVFARHRTMQQYARAEFRNMGLTLFNEDQDAAFGLTVACVPSEMNVKAWLKKLKTEDGLWLAGGQGELEGKIFRISHMGAIQMEELKEAMSIIRRHL